jgi:hypothetical protein
MTTKRFQKDDFVFCDFKLQQIKRMEGTNIVEVSDGYFCLFSNSLNDRCFELSLSNKSISDSFERIHNKLHEIKNGALNHPDMNRYLIDKWCDACNSKTTKEAEAIMNTTYKWYEEIRDFVENQCQNKCIDGVPVFRPRV